MKKATILKIALCVLVVILALGCFFACGKNNKQHNVVFMDGETVISNTTVEDGQAVTLPTPTKDGYNFVGWYTDVELTTPYVAESEVTEDFVLYAKFSQRALYINVNTDGGSSVEKISVTTGASYSVPSPTKEGCTFLGYVYLDENGDERTFTQSGTYSLNTSVRLTARWSINVYRVEYKNGEDELLSTDSSILYGQSPRGVDMNGYTIEGYYDNKDFTGDKIIISSMAIKQDTVIYVNLIPNVYHLTVLGWNDLSCDVTYGETYSLPDPDDEDNDLIAAKVGNDADHEWATFGGYTLDGETFAPSGIYPYARNLTIQAIYTPNPLYNMCSVTFVDTIKNLPVGDPIVLVKGATIASTSFPVASNEGYTFVGWFTSSKFAEDTAFNGGVVNADLNLYGKFTPNSYVITCDGDTFDVTYGQEYELPAEKYGYVNPTYTYNNENFPRTGTYMIADDITVTVDWEVDNSPKSYYVENNVYIFLKGMGYSFNYDVSSSSEKISVDVVNGKNVLTPLEVGDEIEFVVDGDPYVCNIVEYVTAVDTGDDFQTMLVNSKKTELFQNTLPKNAKADDVVLDVGVLNFKPDISILNDDNQEINLEAANVVVTAKEGESDIANFVYTLEGDKLNVDSQYIGKTLTLQFNPKYYTPNHANPTLKVKFNDGVNVYDNAGLKGAYANMDNSVINILRNFKAKLEINEYEVYTGITEDIVLTTSTGTKTITVDSGTPLNNYWSGVYVRSSNNQNDNVSINGNYYTIDGSSLPYHKQFTNRTLGVGYQISEVQSGIFLYRCVESSEPTDWKSGIDLEYNGGHASFNNLRIEGNNIYSSAASTVVPGQELPLIQMSASYVGVVVRGGTINMDNVSIANVGSGFLLAGGVSGKSNPTVIDENEQHATILNLNNCLINNCWANSIYCYDLVKVDLINTKIGNSCGPAIHFDDRPYGGNAGCGVTNLNSSLNMDIFTAHNINNWVTGEEPWFVAYGKSDIALGAKQGFADNLNPMGSTALKDFTGVEMFNFAIVVLMTDDKNTSAWENDKDHGIALDVNMYGYVAENSFIAPYHSLADKELVEELNVEDYINHYLTMVNMYSEAANEDNSPAERYQALQTATELRNNYVLPDENIPTYVVGGIPGYALLFAPIYPYIAPEE